MFSAWINDNCGKSDFNQARKKWAIIGDNDITREVTKDLKTYINIRRNARQLSHSSMNEYLDEEDR